MLASNHMHMTAVRWIGHMIEDGVPIMARAIAIHATFFAITSNDNLVQICGASDNTISKWKKWLLLKGWVHIPPCLGGRGYGIEVFPAYRGTPVSFTDITQETLPKFEANPPQILRAAPTITPPNFAETPPKNEVITPPISEEPPQILVPIPDDGITTRASARADSIYNINNIYKQINILLEERGSAQKSETPPNFELSEDKDQTEQKPPKKGRMLAVEKGSRLPKDWVLPSEWRTVGEKLDLSDAQIDNLAADFADYWLAKAGSAAIKVDWFRTWSKWVRTAVTRYDVVPEGRAGLLSPPKKTDQKVGAFFETKTGKEMVARLGKEGAEARYLQLLAQTSEGHGNGH